MNKRNFLKAIAALYGVSILSPLQAQSYSKGKAKRIIHLWMSGGMSHLDTFSPSKDAKNVIETNVDGLKINEGFSQLSQLMNHACVIRGLSITQGAHEEASYLSLTSYAKRGTITHPSIGSWIQKLGGNNNPHIPNNVQIGGGMYGSGWMEPIFSPVSLNSPTDGIKNSFTTLQQKEFNDRLELKNEFDSDFTGNSQKTKGFDDAYKSALKLMASEDLKAFDLTQESEVDKNLYGNNSFGLGCLLARRLVEYDVKYVQVSMGGFDLHSNIDVGMTRLNKIIDQALSTLIIDLKRRGLLDETLIVLNTEFGRTPKINDDDGRDHHPQSYCGLMIGGGIKGGTIYGAMNDDCSAVIENKCTPNDINATIGSALGLDISKVLYSPNQRPFTMADKGKVLPIFA